VMLENIVRYMEMGHSRMEAALLASREIGFTIVSMTLSLVAVFIPVLFMGGIVGRLLHEFSVTIVVSILISGFVSLTLTPMLGSRFLRVDHEAKHTVFYRTLEGAFDLMAKAYETTLQISLRHQFATLMLAVAMLAGSCYLFFHMPTGFIPSQDSGFLFGVTKGGQDISFESMAAHHEAVVDILARQPAVKDIAAFAGGGNQAFFFANMKPRAQRNVSVDEFIDQMRPQLFGVPGILAFMQNPPPITVSGTFSTSVYQLTVQSASLKEIYAWAPRLMEKMTTLPGFQDVNSDMELASPQLYVDIDRDRATAVGVTPDQIQNALYAFYGQRQVSTIYSPANQYVVLMEVEPRYQRTPDALAKLYVRSSSGKLIPLNAVVTARGTAGPLTVNHFGQLPAVTISFNLSAGSSLGDATQAVEGAITEMRMPPTVSTSFQGTVKEFQQSFQGLSILLIVAVLVIYIVLGVLYESFIHPITILSGLPAAVIGALLTLLLFKKHLDLYAFVGLIMLFGVVKKNAIMMIDFALEAQRVEGKDPYHAIYQGCLLRFRPIMMTTVAALFGTLPIALGYGEGADARQPLGLAVVGGLVVSQFLTLYITPVIYLYMERLQALLRGKRPVANTPGPAEAGA